MSEFNDYTSLSVSTKGKILLHAHGKKVFAFYAGRREDDIYGFEADITCLDGLSVEQLLNHEYKTLYFKLDSEWALSEAFDFCILLANGVNADAIQLRNKKDFDNLHFRTFCAEYKKECGTIIISPQITDYFDLDPVKYERLVLVGYGQKAAKPVLILKNLTVLDSFSEIVERYLHNCNSVSIKFISWAGTDREQWYISYNKINHMPEYSSILDTAISTCSYESIERLVRNGCRFNVFTDSDRDLWFKDDISFFKAYDNICKLIGRGVYHFSHEDFYHLLFIFVSTAAEFSRLNPCFIHDPAITLIRDIDIKLCTYIERLISHMPAFVFEMHEYGILHLAVRSLNLFPACFSKILRKSSVIDACNDEHSLFYEFCWDWSRDISTSWLIFDQLASYRFLMKDDERKMFTERGKTSTELNIDSIKAEAGALLLQLICSRALRHSTEEDDKEISDLLDIAGSGFANPLGFTPVHQAVRQPCFDSDFLSMVVRKDKENINRANNMNMIPLTQALDRYADDTIEFLISNGADPDIAWLERNIGCELAAIRKETSSFSGVEWHIFDSLANKTFLTEFNAEGKTPFLVALENKNLVAARYLGEGGFIRDYEKEKILAEIKNIRNSDVRVEILEMVQKYFDMKEIRKLTANEWL